LCRVGSSRDGAFQPQVLGPYLGAYARGGTSVWRARTRRRAVAASPGARAERRRRWVWPWPRRRSLPPLAARSPLRLTSPPAPWTPVLASTTRQDVRIGPHTLLVAAPDRSSPHARLRHHARLPSSSGSSVTRRGRALGSCRLQASVRARRPGARRPGGAAWPQEGSGPSHLTLG
jgi:hypothetical protein